MPHPWVSKATIKGGKIVLAIELDKYLAGESVEISGYVTQNSGGFATVYAIQNAEETPDGAVVMYVSATPSQAFRSGEDVTASLRASRVWVTVLTASQDGEMPLYIPPESTARGVPAEEGASWSTRTVVWASPESASTSSADQTSVGSDSIFQSGKYPVRPLEHGIG